jgi:hypothetical protein
MEKTLEQVKEIYKNKIRANNILRKAFEAIQHHKSLTRKIEAEFKKLCPECCFHYENGGSGSFTQTHIKIWGKDLGLSYDDGLFYCMNNSALATGWQAVFEIELQRQDLSDTLEQLEMEEGFYSKLADIDKKIEALKQEAKSLYPEDYLPKSAKLRSEVHFSEFSYTTKRLFPMVFDYRN